MITIGSKHPLIFMHLPKTGGMSVFVGFCQEFGTDIADMYNISDRDSISAGPLLENNNTCVYCGHFPFGLHEWLARPSSYISVVRHPVSRIASLYHYISSFRVRIANIQQQNKLPLADLLQNGSIPLYYEDFLPWLEAEDVPELFLECQAAELDNGMVRRFSAIGMAEGRCPDEALDTAKENIEKYFSVVGVLEQFPQTLDLLNSTFGWPWLKEYKVNISKKKQDSVDRMGSESLRKRIEEINRLDLELYMWIKERFNNQLTNPPAPVSVPGGGRTDYENLKLWKAVGYSPLRVASMQQKGLPAKKETPPVKPEPEPTKPKGQVVVRFRFD